MMKELAKDHPYLLAGVWLGTVVTLGSVVISHFASRGAVAQAEADAAAKAATPPPTK